MEPDKRKVGVWLRRAHKGFGECSAPSRSVINYGLTYIGVNPYWQYIIKGAIIIFAVALDSLKYARKK